MQAEASHSLQLSSPSPSFSTYSSETLAEIAARVIDELSRDPHSVTADNETLFESWEQNDDDDFTVQRPDPIRNDDVDADDGDFEFSFVSRDPNSSPVSADDIFYNGQIRPTYPIFDRNLLFGDSDGGSFSPFPPVNDGVAASVSPIPTGNHEKAANRRRRPPLRKLMFEEGETGSCSSSTSEAEDNNIELESVAEGSYCVWTPKASAAGAAGRGRKKSNSTGSASKRWNLRDMLLRSHSEGKEPVLYQSTVKRSNKVAQEAAKHSSGGNNNGGGSVEHEGQHYLKNRGMAMAMGTPKEGDQSKRRSFLPYRQELVGLFSNVNGLGRNLNPF